MPQFNDDIFLGSALTYMGADDQPVSTSFTGSMASTVLTVTAMQSDEPIQVGMYVHGTGVTDGTYITAFGTGLGGVGTYTINQSVSASSTTMTAGGNFLLGNPSPMERGVGPMGRIYVFDCVPQARGNAVLSTAATYTVAGNATLVAGAGVKAVVNANGTTVYELDVPRAISITIGTGTIVDTAVTVSGFDYYGQSMTEVIQTGTTQSTTVNGKKAFYQVSQVAIGGNCGGTIAVGNTNIIGLPIRVTDVGYIAHVGWAETLARNAGTFVAAVTTTASATTGDVRGTYTPSTAPNGIRRLVMGIMLPAIAAGPNATRAGAFGVTQA